MFPKHVSTLLTTGNEITRIFHIPPNQDVLVIRHAPLTDSIEVTLNGLLNKTIEEDSTRRWFAHKKKKYVITITPTSNWLFSKAGLGTFNYTLQVDGKEIPENNLTFDQQICYPNPTNLSINEFVIQGDGVVWYLIRWPELNVHVHRRYRDFWLLYSQICSAYRGTHLYSSVPEAPPREMTILQSNKTPAFLENRMRFLEIFLKRLANFPGIKNGMNPDYQEFLGIGSGASGVFETSVVFQEGKLGMKLKQPAASPEIGTSTFSAQVSDILQDGNESQAARFDSNRIRPGDMITRVGGESALLVGYDKVLSLLQAKELRPVVVHLLGVRDVLNFPGAVSQD